MLTKIKVHLFTIDHIMTPATLQTHDGLLHFQIPIIQIKTISIMTQVLNNQNSIFEA